MQSFGSRAHGNPLEEYFRNNPGRLIHKWHHYFEIYHRHFERFRGRAPVVLEIGVQHGGSAQMWREYFGAGAAIIGVDINPACSRLEEPQITVVIGDQANRAFLGGLRARFPRVDILIDDGGHTMTQQIATFEELYPHVQPAGVYLCEDLHTSYWPDFGGGLRRDGTFIEYSKTLIDRLHGWHSAEPGLAVDDFTRGAFALHYYDSILVIEKRPVSKPVYSRTGRPSLNPLMTWWRRTRLKS
jgi:SAM-dependent methyltransferase